MNPAEILRAQIKAIKAAKAAIPPVKPSKRKAHSEPSRSEYRRAGYSVGKYGPREDFSGGNQ